MGAQLSEGLGVQRRRGHRAISSRRTRHTSPSRTPKPWLGREKIVAKWLKNRDEPGTTTFEWHPLIVTPELAIIEATTTYPKNTFSNLWVLRLDNLGQARQFTEWWMQHPNT